ncbi:alpha/beta fold hydrolase [Amycolatopsis azurea]|uniref:Alpha/beta hydrolase n=1 Tax=Amycolatopsis azurea DSM 43854 TaxID=1238180 RepID=M2PFI8_9PSEU|nr:alpha/beta hydrolase [Amycolatopsis azurea]EMD23143.1 putative hydrolase [Amycolatopsis azurea DSM 43854]OOC03618.1 alpha/beta hydrolase [Amycolatopsis azurea DSM 43854]
MRKYKKVMTALAAAAAAVVLLGGAGAGATANTGWRQSDAALARSLPGKFESAHADVNGVRLHYVAGGSGSPVVLLPGWPQTWWSFHKVMPALAAKHRVIAVDLRGMGGSSKPAAGYDKETLAADVHALVTKLGYAKADVVGHDIGAMVAHSYGIKYPQAVGKLALMDVVAPDKSLYQLPLLPSGPGQFSPWWWTFNQLQGLPEQLVSGRSRYLVDAMIDQLSVAPAAVSGFDRDVYARAYGSQEAVRAGNGWYRTLNQDIAAGSAYGKLTMPVLGLAGEFNHQYFLQVLPSKAADPRVVKIAGAGHYLSEEQPAQIIDALEKFLG